ncbi:MAG: hypothetical protein AABM32_09365 [Chloroflexota bacterium]
MGEPLGDVAVDAAGVGAEAVGAQLIARIPISAATRTKLTA